MEAPPPPPLPALPDDVVEEILLRLPPDDPGCLFRASLVCKAWRSAVTHPHFRRRYIGLHRHRAPPVLGFLHDWEDERIPDFVPTTAPPFSLAAPDRRFWRPLDCRHGRALFLSDHLQETQELLLWEPITGALRGIPVPAAFRCRWPTAAVFCTADGCDHRDCAGGPFGVVFVFAVDDEDEEDCHVVTSACLYSSETGTWGQLNSRQYEFTMYFEHHSSVLVGRSLLYFLSDGGVILEYNLDSGELAVLDTPPEDYGSGPERFNLMLAEDGGLGVAEAIDFQLILWKREVSDGTDARWVLSRIVDVGFFDTGTLAPVLGFAEGANAIFVKTVYNLSMIELQSEQAKWECDNHGFCNLIPVVSFYTPHSRLQVPGGEHHGPVLRLNLLRRDGQQGAWEEKSLEWAQVLFDKGCKAINEKDFANAADCFKHALEIRVRHYGGLAPECASTFYNYGGALLCKAREATNPSGSGLKRAPNEESITPTTSTDDAGSSEASGSSVEHAPPSRKGANLHGKGQKDGNMTGDGDDSDLDLAWKMLNTARVIVAKSPDKTMEKVNILNALAETSMRRGDRDRSIDCYIEALAILEHLVRPDHFRIFQQNVHICFALELASKVEDAIPYCAEAISVGKWRMHNLINAKEALLSDKGRSGKSTLEDEISYLARMLGRLQKKVHRLDFIHVTNLVLLMNPLEELEQAMSTPSDIMKRVVSQASHEQNVNNTMARTASSTSQMAGSNNSVHSPTMSPAAARGSTGSSLTDFEIVGRDMKRANDKPISDEPSQKRLAADDSPSVNEI
ncbi:uncharacterized protein LOC125553000 isoform X2 [Triticum urartu]|uniref:uncharacterized protein LOC125553000 isoform X2 n=1 Tax=Triticum urartu TaxID=4572 RepID=UPI00204429E9|nr:uncharacterized protein LOC125553000 isoform X2 [Triticum urartu]